MEKFTFKKKIKTGRFSSFEKEYHTIKLNKKLIGGIHETDDGNYQIRLMVQKEKTKEDPAPFKNVFLKMKFDNAELAREFVNKNSELIMSKFNLHQIEDE